jgi:hypothetical protein
MQAEVSNCFVGPDGCNLNSPVPEAPQTIKQNWMPFLTFFFRRILPSYQQLYRQRPKWWHKMARMLSYGID